MLGGEANCLKTEFENMPFTKAQLQQEAEANYFACCLLMPEESFTAQWKELIESRIDEDEVVIKLSKDFQVPMFAVVMRMGMIDKMQFLNST